LVHADHSRNVRERVRIAAAIALREDALLVGAAITGESGFNERAALVNGYGAEAAIDFTAELEKLRQSADDALRGFEQAARELNVLRLETHVVGDSTGDGFGWLMRSSDLVVIGQSDPDDPSIAGSRGFAERVVGTSARPVLVVPYAGHFDQAGSRVLIGWDASPCATRATTFALPLLRRAEQVGIIVFNAGPPEGAVEMQAGTEAVRYLACHGVKARLERQEIGIDPGNALLSLAADYGSNLLVMGAYGHSRLRERLLGGTTRTVLGSTTVPVLLSH
jgi:nucleotide-binding universal stress UspA family protein